MTQALHFIFFYYTAQLERRETGILIGRERVTSESIFSGNDRNNRPLGRHAGGNGETELYVPGSHS